MYSCNAIPNPVELKLDTQTISLEEDSVTDRFIHFILVIENGEPYLSKEPILGSWNLF